MQLDILNILVADMEEDTKLRRQGIRIVEA